MSPSIQVAPVQVAPVQVGAVRAPVMDAVRFIVGRDPEGHWVAVEIHGRAGGLFRSRRDAVHFAEDESGHRPDAVLLSEEPVALSM